MASLRITFTIDDRLVKKIDRLVEKNVYPSRGKMIQEAVAEMIVKLDTCRLARECANVDPQYERAIAEECVRIVNEIWVEY